MNNFKAMAVLAVAALATTSCENSDWSFPDFKYSTAYFAYQGDQNPIRTITLGDDDVYDTSMDNNHQFQIVATMGGVYENNQNVEIDIEVDNSLCDGLTFKDNNEPVVAMPSNYYTLASNKIIIPSGKVIGGVTVTLSDAYFADPKATETNYVIPVVMKKAVGVDSILCGKPLSSVANPSRTNLSDWEVAPKDYVLYAVKYINKYQANYLRRGVDNYSGAKTGTEVRHAASVEKDEVLQNQFKTSSINDAIWSRSTKNLAGDLIDCQLKLSFSGDACTVSSLSDGVKAQGSGKFEVKGDSWGGKERNVLYLDYQLEYDGIKCSTKDTLVVRDRGVKPEWFSFVKK